MAFTVTDKVSPTLPENHYLGENRAILSPTPVEKDALGESSPGMKCMNKIIEAASMRQPPK